MTKKFRKYDEPLLSDEWVKNVEDKSQKIQESFSDAVKRNDSEMMKMYLMELCELTKDTIADIQTALKVPYGKR